MINKQNIEMIKGEIEDQTIVAATKYVGVIEIKELYDEGITNVGENRVDAFLEKYEVLHDLDITWHFIGHLQSKKVKKMINKVDYLHALDRLSLADAIQKYRKLPLNCFLEVNISDEDSKYGLHVNDVFSFCDNLENYDKINVVGLMGMAKLTDDKAEIKREFLTLVALQKTLNERYSNRFKYLSMGMSNDYLTAIECGATHLRLGSILFRNEE